jgi:hypothetical protein
MSRIVEHQCWRDWCNGTRAEWSGTALFCSSCDAWQRDKYPKTLKAERKQIRKNKVNAKTQPFDFGFVLAEGFVPEPEPEWHHSSSATNMVLAMEYHRRVKAAHDKYTSSRWNSYAKKAGICLDHGNALPCDDC